MKNEEMALLFSEATPYIQKYHGKTLVIKYGGNAMVNEELKLAVMNDLVTLTLLGVRVVLVHGGGPAINQMLNRVGKESKFVNGLRYTDKETMSIVQQVLAGQVNKDLVALLKGRGVGLCGLDGHTITCSRKSDVDLGYVGNVEKVDTTLIEHLLNDGFIPVIATVGMDENGIAYNINADTAAAAIAIALHAEKFVSMTDIVGLLYDKDDESTLIPAMLPLPGILHCRPNCSAVCCPLTSIWGTLAPRCSLWFPAQRCSIPAPAREESRSIWRAFTKGAPRRFTPCSGWRGVYFFPSVLSQRRGIMPQPKRPACC